jgi:hypothetical protein
VGGRYGRTITLTRVSGISECPDKIDNTKFFGF